MEEQKTGYMETKEAAKRWGVSQRTVSEWCNHGKIVIKPEKVKGKWQIPIMAKPPNRK